MSSYNRVFPQHRLGATAGKRQFTAKEVFALARSVGFTPEQAVRMTEIAKGESGFFPGIWGIDANAQQTRGYGLWAMTPETWGKNSAAYRKFQQLGGAAAMLNPVKNAQMAKFLYDAAGRETGNPLKPWYGTRYLGTMKLSDVQGGDVDVSGGGEEKRPTQVPAPSGVPDAARRQAVAQWLLSGSKDITGLASTVSSLEEQQPPQQEPKSSKEPNNGPQMPRTDRNGNLIVPPGANRAGVGLTPGIMKIGRQVAGQFGKPLTVGTGTNHSMLTTSKNVSDHWQGNGIDIPAAGAELTKLGRDALIAAGMPRAQAMKATGGIYNIPYGKKRRIQVLFNTNTGGNHFNHLHVGVTPPR